MDCPGVNLMDGLRLKRFSQQGTNEAIVKVVGFRQLGYSKLLL